MQIETGKQLVTADTVAQRPPHMKDTTPKWVETVILMLQIYQGIGQGLALQERLSLKNRRGEEILQMAKREPWEIFPQQVSSG